MSFDTKLQHTNNDPFLWWLGVCEDINDPLKLGRVRVRVVGDHTQSKKKLPTNGLPWATPSGSIYSASMSGIGESPNGILQGSWCWGFYIDSQDKQQMMLVGTIGGIPEAIAWTPDQSVEDEGDTNKSSETNMMGFQDPNQVYPLPQFVFEQDTNRLAKGVVTGAIEVPESLVPKNEQQTDDAICPQDPKLALQYVDKEDYKYILKYAKNDDKQQVELEDDEQKQYKLNNNHPFTVYKFVNRERLIPVAKPFADYSYQKRWNEPQNPYAAQYPYNQVYESVHKMGDDSVYGYDQTITNYDGSKKEGIHRKQKCGLGNWGLGEEKDSTPGQERYHRFHPKGNYFEIDKDGNEVRKIYGDNFEINIKDKKIYIKGDFDVTVEGNKNELIKGDYNLQVIGNMNTDIRGSSYFHTDNDRKIHVRGDNTSHIDGDDTVLIRGNRNTTILVKDYVESQTSERHANSITRTAATDMTDNAFMTYNLNTKEADLNICTLDSVINTWNSTIGTLNEKITTHNQSSQTYVGYIQNYTLNSDNLLFYFQTEYEVIKQTFIDPSPGNFTTPITTILGNSSYCQEEISNNECKPQYHSCIEAAKAACMTTLIDPKSGKSVTRIDWEKYHDSIDSCRRSYENCISSANCSTSSLCSPIAGNMNWTCEPAHDPNCPVSDKVITNTDGCPSVQNLTDPWKNQQEENP